MTSSPRRPHLAALDVVRGVTLLTVVSVHSLSVLLPAQPAAAGGVLGVFHSSRDVFLLLSATVLTWSSGADPVDPRRFWWRRVPLVAAPYLVWSGLYFLADGPAGSPAHAAGRLGLDLVDGGARYHLYFLLLTFQLYLVFPWLLPWVRARAARPWRLLAASCAVELAFTAAAHWQLPLPPPLSWLTAHPGSWLPSYQFYIVAGVVVGVHATTLSRWCGQHLWALGALAAATVGVVVGTYAVSVWVTGQNALYASSEWQPTVVLVAVALGAFELGVGQRIAARAGMTTRRQLADFSDASFGVYLAHPLLLQAVLTVTPLPRLLAGMAPAAAVGTVLVVVVPAVTAVTVAAVRLGRATPLSTVLTGRRPLPSPGRPSTVTLVGGGTVAEQVGV